MNLQAIVFDCDGVLIDSKRANEAFYNYILKRFNLPPLTPKELEVVHVLTAEQAINYLFNGRRDINLVKEFVKTIDYSIFYPYLKLEPGLIEFLEEFKKRFSFAVSTNRSNTIRPILKFFNIYNYFSVVVSSLDVKKPKPNPESLFYILEKLNLLPHEVLFIGDSEIDEEAASKARVYFVAYKNPHLKKHLWKVDSYSQLANLIRSYTT